MRTVAIELTQREMQIAELFAWGAAKKDVSSSLFISERTVENHARNIYDKTGCSKVNELSAWWFCTHFGISFDLSPIKRGIIALALLMITSWQTFALDDDVLRIFKARRVYRYSYVMRRNEDFNTDAA